MEPSPRVRALVLPFVLTALALLPAGSAAGPQETSEPDSAATAEPAGEAAETAPAAEPPSPSGKEALLAAHEYLLRDGGRWRAANADHRPGDGSPVAFGYRFTAALDGAVVRGEILGWDEEGAETVYWLATAAWDPAAGEVALFNVGRDGDLARGVYRVIDATHHRLDHRVAHSSGVVYELRDEMEIVGPDEFRSVSSVRREGGEWRVLARHHWKRLRD